MAEVIVTEMIEVFKDHEKAIKKALVGFAISAAQRLTRKKVRCVGLIRKTDKS